MLRNKKIFAVLVVILLCIIGILVPKMFNNEKEHTFVESSKIEKKNTENSISEEKIKEMKEKRASEIKNWNDALSIATDIYNSVLEKELNITAVMFENNGIKEIDGKKFYSIILKNKNGDYLKELGLNMEEDDFVYIEGNKTIDISNYQDIGEFSKVLQPWYLEENRIVIEESQYERYGTVVYLYREDGILKLSISTYNGFAEIAQIDVVPKINSDTTLSFEFEDDKFGHSGKGTLTFVSEEELTLNIKLNSPDESFGVFNGNGKLYQAKQ